MEENNQNEINEENKNCECGEKKHICFKDHCWKMCLGMVIAAFLGGFLATYFVADQMAEMSVKRHFVPAPKFEEKIFNDFDRDFRYDMKNFRKIMKKHNNMPDFRQDDFDMMPMGFIPAPVKVKSEFEDGNFNVEVGLKPFQDDENKVNYNVAGRKLTVFGESKVKDGKNEQDISFSHDFILPENADILNIKKEKIGNKLVISVPMK